MSNSKGKVLVFFSYNKRLKIHAFLLLLVRMDSLKCSHSVSVFNTPRILTDFILKRSYQFLLTQALGRVRFEKYMLRITTSIILILH